MEVLREFLQRTGEDPEKWSMFERGYFRSIPEERIQQILSYFDCSPKQEYDFRMYLERHIPPTITKERLRKDMMFILFKMVNDHSPEEVAPRFEALVDRQAEAYKDFIVEP